MGGTDPSPSPRVRLEVAFLDADQAAPAPAPSDLRRYVRECLRERADLRLLEAATASGAVTLAAQYSPDLLIVDGPESDALETLSQFRAIVIVDDVPRGAPVPGTRLRLLGRPFTAEGLVAEVGQLLG